MGRERISILGPAIGLVESFAVDSLHETRIGCRNSANTSIAGGVNEAAFPPRPAGGRSARWQGDVRTRCSGPALG